MSFKIHYRENTFNAEEFSKGKFSDDFAEAAAKFIACWLNDLPFVFYTSGSTAHPKAFGFTKKQLQMSAAATIAALGLREQTHHVLLCLHPRFVGGAMMLARALELNCELTLLEPRNDVFSLIAADHPYTFASFVPSQLHENYFDCDKFNRFKQVLVGGASISSELENRLRNCAPLSYHTYGMTETLSHIALRRIGYEQSFTPLPSVEIKTDERSCICIKANFNNDWVVTNDVVELNDNGSFKFIGRIDFVINSGAYKIYPEQVEEMISSINSDYHFIKGVFLVSSIKDPLWGEKCVLVLKEELNELSFTQLLEMLAGKISKYALPKEIIRINEWKLTENGKINRKAVKELIDNQFI